MLRQKKNRTCYCACMLVLRALSDVRFFSCWRKSQARETIPLVAATIPCIKLVMVSISYRIPEGLKLDRVSEDHLVQCLSFKTESTRASCQGGSPAGLWVMSKLESPQPLWATSSNHFQHKFFQLFKMYQVAFFASFSTIGHHWKVFGSLVTPIKSSLRRSPWTFLFPLNSCCSLSLSSYDRCSNSLIIFVGVWCTPSCVFIFLLCWIIRTQHSTPGWTHQGWADGKVIFPQVAGSTHNNALGSSWGLFLLQWHTAGSYSTYCLSSPCLKNLLAQSILCVELFLSIYRTLFPFDELHEVPVSPFLHHVEVPLDGSTTIWCRRYSS